MPATDGIASPADPFDAGPYTRLQDALRLPHPCGGHAAWRAVVAAAVAWVPLLLLSMFQGPGRHGFLPDLSAHARYLVAIPLLVGAEAWCLPQLAAIVRHFAAGGLIGPGDRPRWEALVAEARRRLDHRGVEVVLAVGAYAVSVAVGGVLYSRARGTWASPAGVLSPAGWWQTLVSQPLFLLCVLAWLWRVVVWARLLWGLSRLQLRLVPAHPDRAAGLRFVGVSLRAFAPVALAIGVVVAARLAGEVVSGARSPAAFSRSGTVILAVVASVVLFGGPLLVFVGPLYRARMRGVLEYGALASGLGRHFEARWLRRARPLEPDALAAPDFSATTDLYSIVSNVHAMIPVPAGVRDLAPLVVATLLPFIPLVFLVMPFSAVVKGVTGALF